MCTIDDYGSMIAEDLMIAARDYHYMKLLKGAIYQLTDADAHDLANSKWGIRCCMYAIALMMLYGGEYT